MSKNINQISKKLTELKKTIDNTKFDDKKEISSVLNEVIECLSKLTDEISIINNNVDNAKTDIQDLEERFTELEEYLEDEDFMDDDVIASMECPHCKAEVIVGKEFVVDEDPKIVCKSCNKEIEILTSCVCGDCDCDDNCEDDCGCGCDCDCEENEEDDCCSGKCNCQ
jgi:predicted nuclease with TOPRIM domain